MKQRVTSEDIACLVPALNKFLDSAYLVQIYDGAEDNTRKLIMKFRNKIDGENKTYYLLLESGIRVHTIENFVSVRPGPSGCVSKIRKEIGDKRLYPIKQIGTDRSMDFFFSNEKHFIIELYDRGNFIITDKDYMIIYVTRPYELQDHKIDINNIYPIDVMSNSGPQIKNNISDAKGYMIDKCNFSGFPLDSKNQKEYEDINIAMKEYFGNETIEKEPTKKKKKKEKKDNKKFNIDNQISKLENNENKILDKARDFEDKINDIQYMIDYINKNKLMGMPFFEIENFLIQKFIDYKINVNHKFLLIDNDEIDYTKSAYLNLSNIYNKKKVVTSKKQRAIENKKNIKLDKPEVEKKKLVINRKHMKFESYWWFIKDNFIILCGKSADDNETLLNNVEPSDILVHGHFDKSPWGVIKNPKKLEIPFKIINYAGYFLVHRSWSWTENYSNDSYYTYPNKISKSAPSGEFMGKGSRMVHEKNFLSQTPMEMALGVIFKSGDNYIENLTPDIIIDFAMVMCGPCIAMSNVDYKIKVKPSPKKNDKGRKKLIQSAIDKILKIKNKHPSASDYIKSIPFDEWDKVCIRTFIL